LPALQEPPPQSWPQVPQFFGSLVKSTQKAPQAAFVSGLPLFAVHVPVLHEKQLPLHAELQQCPSAEQVPLPHSCPEAHAPPAPFLATQLVPLQ
jgi:hypothetical protein